MSTQKRSRTFIPMLTLLIFVLIFLMIACSSSSSIIGKWQHLPNPTPTSSGQLFDFRIGCDVLYPDYIEFFKDGTYSGQLGSMWGGGNYTVTDNGRIKLDTVQGGISAYDFSISGNILTFTDDSGCTFHYQRVP